ncbi:hypothetical protein P7H16_03845 [Paenibacillus larvae]|nr:hypothetical protein [Paenibacillus larvae]MDT2246294.1 hypothetical protein [Paenibacillus larvae]MDT2286278.1 hypothetical protein [Paenibacillus larvae]
MKENIHLSWEVIMLLKLRLISLVGIALLAMSIFHDRLRISNTIGTILGAIGVVLLIFSEVLVRKEKSNGSSSEQLGDQTIKPLLRCIYHTLPREVSFRLINM